MVSAQPPFPEFRRERKCEVKVCVREGEGSAFLFINPRGNAPHPTKFTHLAPEKGVAVVGVAQQRCARWALAAPGWVDAGVVGDVRARPAACALWRGGRARALSP